jgi:hypothetical protein
MTRGRLLCRAAALAASLSLAACRKPVPEEAQPVKGELPVQQTPVSSIYEEKPGVLYERPQRTPAPTPSTSQPTISPPGPAASTTPRK